MVQKSLTEPCSEVAVPTAPQIGPTRLTVMDGMLVLTMIIWGTHYSVSKAAIEILPPFMFNAFRFTLAAFSTGIFLKLSGQKLTLPRREWFPIIRVGVLSFVIYQAFLMNGLRNTTVANTVLINTSAPIGVVLVNIWTGRERGSRAIYTGIALVVIGVLIVVLSRFAGQLAVDSRTLLGDVLCILGAFVWVVMTLAQRETVAHSPALVVNFWMLLWGAFFVWLVAMPDMLQFDWSKVHIELALAVVYSGLISIGLAGGIFIVGLKRLGASRASIFNNIQPIIAAAVAIVFLHEPFTPWLVIGTAVTLLGLWLIRRG
jgi:drug/metabolite transporter (DMT)-like permease